MKEPEKLIIKGKATKAMIQQLKKNLEELLNSKYARPAKWSVKK